jgi:hypothetical protein
MYGGTEVCFHLLTLSLDEDLLRRVHFNHGMSFSDKQGLQDNQTKDQENIRVSFQIRTVYSVR